MYGFLILTYTERFFFWDMIILMKKVILMIIEHFLIVLYPQYPILSSFSTMTIISLYFYCLYKYKPFLENDNKNDKNNNLDDEKKVILDFSHIKNIE